MATESPVVFPEPTGPTTWPKSQEASFTSSSHNVVVEELDMLLKGHKFHANGSQKFPNRSGSAPPSMEGSIAAIENLIAMSNSDLDASLANMNNGSEQWESEEQFRADPAYLRYYFSNVNLNPRLPPPLVSPENRRLVRHIGGYGNKGKLTSLDDNSNRSLHVSLGILSTHTEEPEDDRSPTSSDWTSRTRVFLSGEFGKSLSGRHKSLVDLIQEDFPRTPSPVYSQSRAASHVTPEEGIDPENHDNSLLDASVHSPELKELNGTSVRIVTSTASPDRTASSRSVLKGKSGNADTHLEDESFISGASVTDSDISSIESEMKAFEMANLSNAEGHRNQQKWQPSQRNNNLQHPLYRQEGHSIYQFQGIQSPFGTQGMNNSYFGVGQTYYGQPRLSSLGAAQPAFHPAGTNPPLYAAATAYVASPSPFYPNLRPSGFVAPPYTGGGYALDTTNLPPFIAGYPPYSATPMGYEAFGQLFNGGSIPPGLDLQSAYKVHGQPGLRMPPFTNPYMQHIQHTPEDVYNVSSQLDPVISRDGLAGSFLPKGSPIAAFTADQQQPYQMNGALNLQNQRSGMVTGSNYHGSPPSMGGLMQFPTSPLASPVMPGSPLSRLSPSGRGNEMKFSPGSSKNVWPGQRGSIKFDDPKTYSYLEDLKSNRMQKFELSDIAGCIVEFSADQHGSRFIQQKLEKCGNEEKTAVFREVLPHASKLMTDVFGNYVIQKFFERGSTDQRKELANQLVGHILPLSLQMYGCRVIQKALEVIELDQKTELVRELDGHVLRCVRDQNGNHVIQKCIECVPSDKIGFIIDAFRGQVANLSTHPYGCRVIQRVLEYCTDELQTQCIVSEILESTCALAQDQYGNYVTQHVLGRGKPHERTQIISKLSGNIVEMSQHKFASNVVEKCLVHGDTAERELLIDEIVSQTEGNDNLLIMMKDQFANYVVQRVLETCTDRQREILLGRIRVHLNALKKYTYGKHIVLRFEQLVGEEETPPSEA